MVKSIPTVYRGVRLKSRLEADATFLLDRLDLSWEYEPQSFLLPNGTHYMPDFWVPAIKLWVECRGYESPHGEDQIKGFTRLVQGNEPEQGNPVHGSDYLVLTTQKPPSFYESYDWLGTGGGDAAVARCTECHRWYFLSPEGAYRCRYCSAWDGDHCLEHMDRFTEGNGYLTLECFNGSAWRLEHLRVKPWLQAHSLLT